MPITSDPATQNQLSQLVNLCVDGVINAILGESRVDKSREMNEHHDRLLEIVEKNKIQEMTKKYATPREQIIAETQEANEHVRSAISELEKAQKLSKCGVCKATLEETIHLVNDKTEEILDASEKVLVMQRLKDVGELPPDIKWDDLNKTQKKQVEHLVERFRPGRPVEYLGEGEENGEETKRRPRKPAQRKPQKRAKARR